MSTTIHRNIEAGLVGNPTQDIPEGMVPEAEQFVVNVLSALDPDEGRTLLTDYGHVARALAQVMLAKAYSGASPEVQRAAAKEKTLKLIDKYGVRIVPFLRDELKLALEGLDLTKLNP